MNNTIPGIVISHTDDRNDMAIHDKFDLIEKPNSYYLTIEYLEHIIQQIDNSDYTEDDKQINDFLGDETESALTPLEVEVRIREQISSKMAICDTPEGNSAIVISDNGEILRSGQLLNAENAQALVVENSNQTDSTTEEECEATIITPSAIMSSQPSKSDIELAKRITTSETAHGDDLKRRQWLYEFLNPFIAYALGPTDETTLKMSIGYGDTFYYQGRYNEALSIWSSIVKTSQQKLEPDNILAIRSKACIGKLHARHGNFDQCLQFHKSAITSARRRYGDLANLSLVHSLNFAKPYVNTDIRWSLQITNHVITNAKSRLILFRGLKSKANLYYSLGHHHEVLLLLAHAQRLCSKIFPPTHTTTFTIEQNIVRSLIALGRFEEALPIIRYTFNKAVGINATIFYPGCLWQSALCYMGLKKTKESLERWKHLYVYAGYNEYKTMVLNAWAQYAEENLKGHCNLSRMRVGECTCSIFPFKHQNVLSRR